MNKTCLILFWFAIISHTAAAVSAAYYGDWIALMWIVTPTMWMIAAEFSSRRADRLYRELIEALEECAKAHFDCLKLTIQNCGLETKNRILEKADCKRQIRRKMHFDRLRKVGDK